MQNIQKIGRTLAVTLAGTLACVAGKTSAQSAVPQLSPGVTQVMQLEQAKISDDTIIRFVRNSGNSYALDATQIVFLRQQGISEAVISAMLDQPKAVVAAASTPVLAATVVTQPATSTVTTTAVETPVAVAPPVITFQTVPAPCYYYYPAYGCYWRPRPLVAVGFGCHGWGVGIRL